jgi:type II secretory pathway predicted ATPase ExeA
MPIIQADNYLEILIKEKAMNNYKTFFGFSKTPFQQNIAVKNLLQTPQMLGVADRIKYAVDLGSCAIVTGEVGAGKSTALRYAISQFHPSEYIILYVTATTGSAMEIYKQICLELKIDLKSQSKSFLIKQIKSTVLEFWARKQKPILIIDEASLLRIDIFAELHTITQFDIDSIPKLPIILAGQNNLIDSLQYQPSRAFASRVVARSKLDALNLSETKTYLLHHLKLAGNDHNLFTEPAITATHKLSSGMLRKINNIARGALIAAAIKQSQLIEPEHVQIAASETF